MKISFKSLYPSITLEDNIASNTQIGRLNIEDKVYEFENPYSIEESLYSRGGEFIENLVTDNIIEFCRRWLHFAGIKEFIDDINEYFCNKSFNNRYMDIIRDYNYCIRPAVSNIEEPISFTNLRYEDSIRFKMSLPNNTLSKVNSYLEELG